METISVTLELTQQMTEEFIQTIEELITDMDENIDHDPNNKHFKNHWNKLNHARTELQKTLIELLPEEEEEEGFESIKDILNGIKLSHDINLYDFMAKKIAAQMIEDGVDYIASMILNGEAISSLESEEDLAKQIELIYGEGDDTEYIDSHLDYKLSPDSQAALRADIYEYLGI